MPILPPPFTLTSATRIIAINIPRASSYDVEETEDDGVMVMVTVPTTTTLNMLLDMLMDVNVDLADHVVGVVADDNGDACDNAEASVYEDGDYNADDDDGAAVEDDGDDVVNNDQP